MPAPRFAGQLYAASSPQNWILSITIPGALIPAILVGSSGDASATALDPIAAWHWPGVLAKLAPPASRHRRPHAATGHPDSRAYPLATCTVPLVEASAALPAQR